jgi:predicted metalloprotease with PDZ domain
MILIPLLLSLALLPTTAKEPRLAYRIRFDSAETTGISVELKVRNAPASMRIAAHAHPEYDDKYWRYVEDLTARSGSTRFTLSRIDSVRWQMNNTAGDVTISYRVKFPHEQRPRAAWRPYLTATGGLVGGPHSFLYPMDLEKEAASVDFEIPAGWKVGTGLPGKSSARKFIAPDLHTLMESPMLVGQLSEWTFSARGIPHRVFYWRLPNATAFDSVAFVNGLEKIASESINFFGSAPYREYSFLFQDDAFSGGLEHPNSLTLGARSEELAKDPNFTIEEAAHEFFHTWNLMAIKPAEYREVDYRIQGPVAELWFSEGLTIYYADLLRRRAGLPTDDSTRIDHLEKTIERYLGQPGLARFSAEQVSRVAYNSSPDALGDYMASAHLEGELLGTILDLKIRDATNGARSMDDVMRLMFSRFRQKKFTSKDVQNAVDEICRCSTSSIFNQHVFNAGAIDFNRYLALIGMKSTVTWQPALNPDGSRQPDLRAWAYERGGHLKFRVGNPESIWGRAGLHTGDEIVTLNGAALKTWPEFRRVFGALKMGDSVAIVVKRGNDTISKSIRVSGYDRPVVSVEPIDSASAKQIRLREAWVKGISTSSAPARVRQAGRQLQ